MTSTCEILETTRSEFNKFDSSVVCPLIGLTKEEMAKLGFAEIARLINDLDIRKRYCDLAIALLNANISHYRSDATPILVRKADNTAVVVSTLLAAAFIQYLNGIVAALFASAAWYWLAAEISRRRLEQLNIDAEAHNELVAGWAETLRGWEVELVALQTL